MPLRCARLDAGRVAQDRPQKFGGCAIAGIAPFAFKLWKGFRVPGKATCPRGKNAGSGVFADTRPACPPNNPIIRSSLTLKMIASRRALRPHRMLRESPRDPQWRGKFGRPINAAITPHFLMRRLYLI